MAYSLKLPFANFVEENYLPLCGLFSQGYSLAGEFQIILTYEAHVYSVVSEFLF